MYSVKEIYYTIQGEGYHTGQPAVFLRFSGCNLWTGLEKDRATAQCKFCDTDFWGTDGALGGKYDATTLVDLCKSQWTDTQSQPWIVCTGGEPLLQLDKTLIDAFHDKGCFIAIETNGTIEVPEDIDWVCVSPKLGSDLIVTQGDELKLVYPQKDVALERYEEMSFDHHSLQPLDDVHQEKNIRDCIDLCKQRPKWRLSLQTHKFMGIP